MNVTEITLYPFEREDFDRLISWIPDSEFLQRWVGQFFKYPLDESQLEPYLYSSLGESPERKIFKAVNFKTGEVFGHIELGKFDSINKSAYLSRVLIGKTSERGKGLGIQMTKKLLEIGFDSMGLHRIQLGVFDFNERAIGCYEKAGFVREGTWREAVNVNGKYWSILWMSILESEWRITNKL